MGRLCEPAVHLTAATLSPHSRWMAQQARNVLWECDDRGIEPRFFIHDRDGSFSAEFDTVLKHAGVEAGRDRGRIGAVHCDKLLGGLLKSYRRAA